MTTPGHAQTGATGANPAPAEHPVPDSDDTIAPSAPGHPCFRMPVLARFMPARRHPAIDVLEQRCTTRLATLLHDAFTSRRELGEFLEHRTSLWSLLAYAHARTDRIELICAWIDVLFAIDDVFAQQPPARIRQTGIYDLPAVIDAKPPAVDTAFTRAFQELRSETLALIPGRVWQRYARTLHGFFQACHTERDLVQDLPALDLPTYEKTRNSSIGECCFPLLEFGLAIDLSDRLQELAELRRLNQLVARHWVGVNDIFSYRKELYSGDAMNEIQLTLAETGGDLQAAVDRIAATVRHAETQFDHLTARLRAGPAGLDGDVTAYLDALDAMIAGNLEWSYLTPRYNGHGHTWNGLTDATVVLTPTRTLYLPHGQARHRTHSEAPTSGDKP